MYCLLIEKLEIKIFDHLENVFYITKLSTYQLYTIV